MRRAGRTYGMNWLACAPRRPWEQSPTQLRTLVDSPMRIEKDNNYATTATII